MALGDPVKGLFDPFKGVTTNRTTILNTPDLLELIHTFSKEAKYKVNIQKLVAGFLYTKEKYSMKEAGK